MKEIVVNFPDKKVGVRRYNVEETNKSFSTHSFPLSPDLYFAGTHIQRYEEPRKLTRLS